jgi:hypothetical protein
LIQPPLQPLSLGSTSITAPDMVRADSVLHYSIMLGDPRVQLGRLTPCPSYTEALGYAGGVHQYSFLLTWVPSQTIGCSRGRQVARFVARICLTPGMRRALR